MSGKNKWPAQRPKKMSILWWPWECKTLRPVRLLKPDLTTGRDDVGKGCGEYELQPLQRATWRHLLKLEIHTPPHPAAQPWRSRLEKIGAPEHAGTQSRVETRTAVVSSSSRRTKGEKRPVNKGMLK